MWVGDRKQGIYWWPKAIITISLVSCLHAQQKQRGEVIMIIYYANVPRQSVHVLYTK